MTDHQSTLARLSKEITDDAKAGFFVQSALREHTEEVAFAVAETEVAATGIRDTLTTIGSRHGTGLDTMVASDDNLRKAIAFEGTAVSQLADDTTGVSTMITGLRRIVLGHHPNADIAALGLQPVEARDAMTLMRRGRTIDQTFQEQGVTAMLRDSLFPDEGSVIVGHAARLGLATDDLHQSINRSNDAARRTKSARRKRDEAAREFAVLHLRTSRVFEDFCRMADLGKLADQVRPTVPRTRTSAEPEGSGPEPSATGKEPSATGKEDSPPENGTIVPLLA